MASGVYNRLKKNLMNKTVDLDSDTLMVALYDASHVFTASDTTYTTTHELATAGGYTQGGQTLNGATITEADITKLDADDMTWNAATFTAFHAVIYDTSASNGLVASFDFGGAKTVAAGTFTIVWDTDGIITLT